MDFFQLRELHKVGKTAIRLLSLKHNMWSPCRMTGNLVEEWECVLEGVYANIEAFGLYSASYKRTLEAF